jgi:hypothetical protein
MRVPCPGGVRGEYWHERVGPACGFALKGFAVTSCPELAARLRELRRHKTPGLGFVLVLRSRQDDWLARA